MHLLVYKKAHNWFKAIALMSVLILLVTSLLFESLKVNSLQASVIELPSPVELLKASGQKSYPVLKGISLDKNEPLKIDFLIDTNDKNTIAKEEAARVVNYFLAGITAKESELWVNLSPYESDRIMHEGLETTDFGKELLVQDYILKQFVSSLTYPNTDFGQNYWEELNSTDVFNKVWIVPGSAKVVESGARAYIENASLDVKYEKDYLASKENGFVSKDDNETIKDLLLEKVYEEVNEGENFAKLRQLYSSLILASWFKQKFRDTFYQNYINQNKLSGIDVHSSDIKDEVYESYLDSFNKGVYDISKKTKSANGRKIKKRYFSGGVVCNVSSSLKVEQRDYINPKIKGEAFILEGYMQSISSSAMSKLPHLSFSKVEPLLMYKSKVGENMMALYKFQIEMGNTEFQRYIDEEMERRETFPKILKKNFKAAIDYFNENVVKVDEEGKLETLTWEKLMDLYALYRGDLDEETYPDVLTKRLDYVNQNLGKVIEIANMKDFKSTNELHDRIAQLYSYFIEYQPFMEADGFVALKEKGDAVTPKASGHNRLAWFIANYMLLNNSHNYFYFESDAEQSELNGKARARKDTDIIESKKEFIKGLLAKSELKNRKVSTLPTVDFYRVEELLKYEPMLDPELFADMYGMADVVEKERQRKNLNTKILRNNFKSAVEFFNQEILKRENGKLIDLQIEDLFYLYAIYRGDINENNFAQVHEERVEVMANDEDFIQAMLVINNTDFKDKKHFLEEVAGVYSYLVDMQPLLRRPEFAAIREKGAGATFGGGGHNRLAWFVMNYMLVKNGYGIFYFSDSAELERFSGKGYGAEFKDILPYRVKILSDTLESRIQNGGVDLNNIDFDVQVLESEFAQVDIDFSNFTGFTFALKSLAKIENSDEFYS